MSKLSRRNFFQTGVGVTGTFIAGSSIAKACTAVTAEQPLGPFFPRAGTPEIPVREDTDPTTPIYLANDSDLTYVKGKAGTAIGQVVHITGKVTDRDCNPVPDATIIIWQASTSGRYNHQGDAQSHDFRHPVTQKIIKRTIDPFFQYWGRSVSDVEGKYNFKTIVPGFYPANLDKGWYRPPHIHFLISAVGFPQFVTQMYFKGEQLLENDWIQELNAKDFLLQNSRMTDAQRKKLVVEFSVDNTTNNLAGQFDIALEN